MIPRNPPASAASSPDYSFSYTENPFGFAVTRNSDNQVLFNSSVPSSATWNGLEFADQYLSLTTQLPSNSNIYGIQESTQSNGFKLTPSTYTLWNHDTAAAATNTNLYGSHPFYLQMLDNGNAHGVFLLSSNGMDVEYASDHLTYNVIGGVLDFYFFSGPNADDVVQQYNTLIGYPTMQPYWAFGFHQCRYGMPNLEYVEQVVANYSAANIPLDTIWSDIDYMDVYKDFTWDPVNYPLQQVQQFTTQLHQQNQQYVIILDPGIKYNDTSYTSFTDLVNSGGYIYDVNGNPFVGQVWPGYTIFPDFLNSNGQNYWADQLNTLLNTVPYDGLWVDMNEISNFCSGECLNGAPVPPSSTTCGCSSSDPTNIFEFYSKFHLNEKIFFYDDGDNFDPENPPYAINNNEVHNPLNNKALDVNAYHFNTDGSIVSEYDAHNLYGLTEARETHIALQNFYSKRPFVLTRSSFPSSGRWTAHWTGDNASQWPDLYYSIVGMLNFNILGIPMIGSDICGFLDTTTEELCSRWIEVGSFYPFSRNHDTIGVPPQELYRWPTVSAISSFILRVRYSLIPLFYTLNYQASTMGSPIIRPLFFQYPQDSNTFGIDKQFLVGDSIMVIPVLTQGATSVSGYFPAGVYYNFYDNTVLSFSSGTTLQLNAPLNFIPLYILGGSIISRNTNPGLTTYDTRMNPFNVTVAFDRNLQAQGELFIDDGETLNYQTESSFITFSASISNGKGSLQSTIVQNGYSGSFSTALTDITFLGVNNSPTSVAVNGASWTSFTYSSGVLTLTGLSLNVTTSFTISFS